MKKRCIHSILTVLCWAWLSKRLLGNFEKNFAIFCFVGIDLLHLVGFLFLKLLIDVKSSQSSFFIFVFNSWLFCFVNVFVAKKTVLEIKFILSWKTRQCNCFSVFRLRRLKRKNRVFFIKSTGSVRYQSMLIFTR